MRYHPPGTFDPSLREVLDLHNADELKRLLKWVPGLQLKAPRKADLVKALVDALSGSELRDQWRRLSPLEQSAVAEAAHEVDGSYNPEAFHAKYNQLPLLDTQGAHQWDRHPTRIRLFLHSIGNDQLGIPKDLRERLLTFVPAPPSAQLASLEQLPEQAPRTWTLRHFNADKRQLEYESHEAPLVQRLTEPAAIQDLRTTLRLIDQGKISVSAATLFPSKASMTLLAGLLREGDYFEPTEKGNDGEPDIGPIKAYSWPLLVQAAKLATLQSGKLALTKRGRTALTEPPATVLRDLWQSWLTNKILDEFSRIDLIKGQKGKGGAGLTPPGDRRLSIQSALTDCPVGRWVTTAEFSRYMQAAGFRFAVTRNAWNLYVGDPKYGSLGYEGYGGWNILQERYLLGFLFEYAAPLGIIDIAYEHPAEARRDYNQLWGADGLSFLSRYDGLKYIRLTPMGAFILGVTQTYEPPPTRSGVSLSVLPKGRLRLDHGTLSPDELLLIESFADRETDTHWTLSERKAIEAIEKGARVGEWRAFLSACDPQPLPETVEAFFNSVEQRGSACVFKGRCLFVECVSPQIAETIARDARAGALCQRTGERGLVVFTEKEEAFRAAINGLGFGMPRV